MTISGIGGSIDNSTTTTTTLAYPTANVGDLLLLGVGAKPSTANASSCPTPTNWKLAFSRTNAGGYGTTLGADTGNSSTYVFWRQVDGTESGNVTASPANSDCCWGIIYRFTKTKGTWDIAGTSGTDTSAGNLSTLMDTDPGIVGGDMIVYFFTDPTNANPGANLSGSAMSCTGVTFGTVTELAEPVTSFGNNVAGLFLAAPVSAGDSAGNLTTVTATAVTGTNVRGPGVMVRLRENIHGSSDFMPFTGMGHHDEPHDDLAGRRYHRRPSGLHVPRRDLTVARAA
jgi:hypothetical protein